MKLVVLSALLIGVFAIPSCRVDISVTGAFNDDNASKAWEGGTLSVKQGGIEYLDRQAGGKIEVCPTQTIWIYNQAGHAIYPGMGARQGVVTKGTNKRETGTGANSGGHGDGGLGNSGHGSPLNGPYPRDILTAGQGLEVRNEPTIRAFDHTGPFVLTPGSGAGGTTWYMLCDAHGYTGVPINVLQSTDAACADLTPESCPEPSSGGTGGEGCEDCLDVTENECREAGAAECVDGACSYVHLKKIETTCTCVGDPGVCASGGISPATVAVVTVVGIGAIGGLVFFGMRDPKKKDPSEDFLKPFDTPAGGGNIIAMSQASERTRSKSRGSGGGRGRSRSRPGSKSSRGSRGSSGKKRSGSKASRGSRGRY